MHTRTHRWVLGLVTHTQIHGHTHEMRQCGISGTGCQPLLPFFPTHALATHTRTRTCCLCKLHCGEDAPPHKAVEHDPQHVLLLQVAAQPGVREEGRQAGRQTEGQDTHSKRWPCYELMQGGWAEGSKGMFVTARQTDLRHQEDQPRRAPACCPKASNKPRPPTHTPTHPHTHTPPIHSPVQQVQLVYGAINAQQAALTL